MYDLLVKNGAVVDGSGGERFSADVGVRGDVIVDVAPGLRGDAAEVVDAGGKVVAPGFIDVHTHDDLVLFEDPYNRPKLLQGVTTVVAGNCGFGPCPAGGPHLEALTGYARPILGGIAEERHFADFAAYADALERLPKGQNIAALLAHGAVYINEVGFDDAKMPPDRVDRAREQVRTAMEHGAVGLSIGFMYAPGCYCGPGDVLPLAEIVSRHGGLVSVHMKSESEFIEESIRDVLEIGRASGAAVHISHLKNVGKEFRGRVGGLAFDLEEKIRGGVDVTFDMYPYTVGGTTMSILFPADLLTGGIDGCLTALRDPSVRNRLRREFKAMWRDADNLALLCGWENVVVSSVESGRNRDSVGKSVADIACERGVPPEDACMDFFSEENGRVAVLLNHMIATDMWATIVSPRCMVVSDGIPGSVSPHPRLYGTFPHFLQTFVRENRLLTLEQAIAKITAMPARRFGLGRRGLIREGHIADIAVFDEAEFASRATFENPRSHPDGLDRVIVAGRVVCRDGTVTGETPGRFIRHGSGARADEL